MPTPDAILAPASAAADAASEASDRLVLDNLPLVRMVAAKLYRLRWGETVGFDDYLQYGTLGLVEAARRYDDTRGAQFPTYATWRITGAILSGLEKATEYHQQITARKRLALSRTQSLAECEPGEARSISHSAEATLAHLAEVAVGLAIGFMLEGSGMYSDGSETVRSDGYSGLANRQLQRALSREVETLPEPERTIIRAHYFQQQPFMAIAEQLRLTKGRVSQLHKRALARLQAAIAPHGAPEFEA